MQCSARAAAASPNTCARRKSASRRSRRGSRTSQAAAIPIAALTALQGLRDEGRVKPGQKVLINGASGGVGTFAVQIAKALGAEVTAVCSARNVELVRSLGADHVIDYTKEDFTRGVRTRDVVLDNVGNHELSAYRRVLTKAGIYVGVGGGGPDDNRWGFGYLLSPVKSFFLAALPDQQFGAMLAEVNRDDLLVLAEMVESARVKPVLDRTYTLEQTAEAIRYLETGRARGKVVIRVADGG